MPFTGTTAPATGPSAGSGSGVGAGQQQSKRSMAPVHSFLSYGRHPQPLGPRCPVASPSPSCDNQPPPPPRCHHHLSRAMAQTIQGRAASPLGLLWPLDPTGATTFGGQRIGQRPPCPGRPGSPARGARSQHHWRRAAPFHLYPSSRSQGQTRGWDSYPPVPICPVRKFLQKLSPGKKTPWGRDPPQFFTQKNSAG